LGPVRERSKSTHHPVSSGLERYTSVDASRDGRRVVSTVANPHTSLWRVPLLDRVAEERDVQPYPMPTARALAPRFAGSSLFYLSARGAADGLWRVEDGQASPVWGGTAPLSEPAAISPDGRRMAIVVRQDGKPHLQVMAADGTSARTLAASIDIQGAASQSTVDWSPDGATLVTGGSDARGPGLFSIPVDGSPPTRLLTGPATNPVWSPDGTLILYSGPLVGGVVPLLATRPDGTPVKLPPLTVRSGGYRFLPDRTGLVYLPRRQSLDFWLLDFATNSSRQLTRLANRGNLATFDLTPDGKSVVFDRSTENSDVVLIDLPGQP
jgi:Tol biopolymer transport system component